jgi:hypothetical protein
LPNEIAESEKPAAGNPVGFFGAWMEKVWRKKMDVSENSDTSKVFCCSRRAAQSFSTLVVSAIRTLLIATFCEELPVVVHAHAFTHSITIVPTVQVIHLLPFLVGSGKQKLAPITHSLIFCQKVSNRSQLRKYVLQ